MSGVGPGRTTSSTPESAGSRSEACIAGDQFTDLGQRDREAVELSTDLQCRPIIASLGDDFDEVLAVLEPMGRAIRDQGGYPASGPHDLAGASNSPSG